MAKLLNACGAFALLSRLRSGWIVRLKFTEEQKHDMVCFPGSGAVTCRLSLSSEEDSMAEPLSSVR
jgi:hypothetical protein